MKTDEEMLKEFDSAVNNKFSQIHNKLKGVMDAFTKGAEYGVVYAASINNIKQSDAIDFQNWMIDNGFEYHSPNKKYFNENFPNAASKHWNKFYTLKNLYKKFKNEKI